MFICLICIFVPESDIISTEFFIMFIKCCFLIHKLENRVVIPILLQKKRKQLRKGIFEIINKICTLGEETDIEGTGKVN